MDIELIPSTRCRYCGQVVYRDDGHEIKGGTFICVTCQTLDHRHEQVPPTAPRLTRLFQRIAAIVKVASKTRLWARVEFKPQDMWIGAFWRTDRYEWVGTVSTTQTMKTDIWICLVPMLPLHITLRARWRDDE